MKIPITELNFSFSRSSGAGGQNVNKVNSKATLRWNIKNSQAQSLPDDMIERFLKKFARYMLDDGTVIITGQRFSSQARNVADCLEKLHEMLENVKAAPIKRRATKPTRGSVEKRLKFKKGKSDLKRSRQKTYSD